MNKIKRGLKELQLCERLNGKLDFNKHDYELIALIKNEALSLYLPTSEEFASIILSRLKYRHYVSRYNE